MYQIAALLARHALLNRIQAAQQHDLVRLQRVAVEVSPRLQLDQRAYRPGRAVPLPDVGQLRRALRPI